MTILDRILETKRVEVAEHKRAIFPADLHAMALTQSPPRGLRAALERKVAALGYGLVAEIKRASPSKGLIRADFDPPAHARAYQAGGAACLSVLTDRQYFQGADSDLRAARAACDLPVLRKDFIVDPWQVLESRAIGADAILIIMAALDDDDAAAIEASALHLEMDVLVEIHDVGELDRALRLQSRLIGVNSRNLNDFSVDRGKATELAGRVPAGCTIVAESGFETRADLDKLAENGINCFLVGEALMRHTDIEAATRKLVG